MVKLAVILGVPIAMLATIASLGVVDVREGGPNGNRIVVPVPLVAAQAALALAPLADAHHAMKLQLPAEAAEHMGLAREVIEAIAAAPDGEYVHVQDKGEEVV